jgi:hypothetical protein
LSSKKKAARQRAAQKEQTAADRQTRDEAGRIEHVR